MQRGSACPRRSLRLDREVEPVPQLAAVGVEHERADQDLIPAVA